MEPNRFHVATGPITLVFVETICGILLVIRAHESVSVDFGHNGCSGDGQGFPVPLGNALLRNVQRKGIWTIDEEKIRSFPQCLHRLHHSPKGRLQDVDPVDFDCIHKANPHLDRTGKDLLAATLPGGGSELFRITHAWKAWIAWENHGSSHNRARQRTAPHLVDARHLLKSMAPGFILMQEHVQHRGIEKLPGHQALGVFKVIRAPGWVKATFLK